MAHASTHIDTIAAIATPIGAGGIGIVRLSGPRAITIGTCLFRPVGPVKTHQGLTAATFPSHQLCYGTIIDPHSREIIDEVMMVAMVAPRSYTKEDVVEIHCHASYVVLERILGLVLAHGARLAAAGEFTRRAYLNGRIDLSQAEAIADLINANSEMARKVAFGQLQGGIKECVEGLIDRLNDSLMQIEARIDFPEDIPSELQIEWLVQDLEEKCITPIEEMVASYLKGRPMREGVSLAIVGRPNVGKSSLLNKLLRTEKAIVTPLPGTTRDPVEGGFQLGGLGLRLIDTAGMHISDDPVEVLGIARTRQILQHADMVLFVVEAHKSLDDPDLQVFSEIHNDHIIIVINKIDLLDGGPPSLLPERMAQFPSVAVSALTGEGLDRLEKSIVETCVGGVANQHQQKLVTSERHCRCFEQALSHLKRAIEGLTGGLDDALISIDLYDARTKLEEIIGSAVGQDILDKVFENFCIGK